MICVRITPIQNLCTRSNPALTHGIILVFINRSRLLTQSTIRFLYSSSEAALALLSLVHGSLVYFLYYLLFPVSKVFVFRCKSLRMFKYRSCWLKIYLTFETLSNDISTVDAVAVVHFPRYTSMMPNKLLDQIPGKRISSLTSDYPVS